MDLPLKQQNLLRAWQSYRQTPRFDNFVEFAVMLNNLTEFLRDKNAVGLHRAGHQLEQQALALFGDETTHPIADNILQNLDHSLHELSRLIEDFIGASTSHAPERRIQPGPPLELRRQRLLWFISNDVAQWQPLQDQLRYFGLTVENLAWTGLRSSEEAPLLLVDLAGLADPQTSLRRIRQDYPASQIICLSVPSDFTLLQNALRAGCDICFPEGTPLPAIVTQILDLNDSQEQEAFRVLVVDDSPTASHVIKRALEENGIIVRTLTDPMAVLDALHQFNPDLLLLDMYMPQCTGVEAARVIRQHNEFLSVPIVYLSGETDLGLQIDALRLGGDHFLTKPFNPLFLNAIVKSKIERYRALRRSMYHDSLTGLLNHTTSKTRLDAAIEAARRDGSSLALAMLDIDHFKKVNDTYGHPIGDQIIRSIAWLLKQRLRRSDIIGRYGGEEFLVALPGATEMEAMVTLDQIRQDFADIRHPYSSGHFQLSFSAGIAGFPAFDQGDALIKAADDVLYIAKRSGRNRICIA
ncbi:diguanylate cyclase (GGDEF) domain-containing protein [Andreprevotia lacus DSM 23236]|jgi:diguanylate cyclase (GGDEF)-like protein|uniref:diguanylate cyclase n=1 Tax=Andreprevotia lacus DSM 23236 TaxID=1121001 RepID=A0A1W1Y0X6_9NEIS|nr:diguanylate cyclase [Andreprevotia lacus]SMC29792.1 diguanylate cyclase (GGDEF) domain-containing protein [Andreprevotia lacus DSM 23236]